MKDQDLIHGNYRRKHRKMFRRYLYLRIYILYINETYIYSSTKFMTNVEEKRKIFQTI